MCGRDDIGSRVFSAPAASMPSAAISARTWRRIRSTKFCTTSVSAVSSRRGSGIGEVTLAFCSTSLIMSNSILVARKSAVADLLTS